MFANTEALGPMIKSEEVPNGRLYMQPLVPELSVKGVRICLFIQSAQGVPGVMVVRIFFKTITANLQEVTEHCRNTEPGTQTQ